MKSALFTRKQEDFICEFCGCAVHGNGYTNHCPQCLYSKHVDIHPGDRLNQCSGLMVPVRLERTRGQMYIVHQCQKCGQEHRNKVSVADNFDALLALSNGSIETYHKAMKK